MICNGPTREVKSFTGCGAFYFVGCADGTLVSNIRNAHVDIEHEGSSKLHQRIKQKLGSEETRGLTEEYSVYFE